MQDLCQNRSQRTEYQLEPHVNFHSRKMFYILLAKNILKLYTEFTLQQEKGDNCAILQKLQIRILILHVK